MYKKSSWNTNPKMKTLRSFEMSVIIYQSTRRHISDDSNYPQNPSDSVKSRIRMHFVASACKGQTTHFYAVLSNSCSKRHAYNLIIERGSRSRAS